MHDFQYISKHSPEVVAIYNELLQLLENVRQELSDQYTFQHRFVGSYSRNMITYDQKGNVGFDFDINIYPNDDDEEFTAKELKLLFKSALDRSAIKYGYAPAEDSTRVLTIKVKDREHSRIRHSVDFAFVNNYKDEDGTERQEYIRYNKKQVSYTWEQQSQGYYRLQEKIEWVKENGLWQQVRDRYIEKKNRNNDVHKHSRTILAETVHEICQINGFWEE